MELTAARRDEAPQAREHLVASLSLLTVGVALLAVRGVENGAMLLDVAPFIVLGSFTHIIVGTSRMLIAGMARRDIVGASWVPRAQLAAITAGSIGVALAPPGLRVLAGALWAAALGSHAYILLRSVARPPTRPRVGRGGRWPTRVMEGASLVYAVAGAVAMTLALTGRWSVPAALHLLLPGFVTLTIFGVASHVLPRFGASAISHGVLTIAAPAAALGPGLVAWGIARDPGVLRAGAFVEATGLVLLSLATLLVLARAPRRRASHIAYGAGALSLVAGVAMGVSFAFFPATRALVPVHGILNLLGFVGCFVLGASHDMYAPAMRQGQRALERQWRVTFSLALSGLTLTVGALWVGAPAVARVGLALYACAIALHLAGAIASMVRAASVSRMRITLRNRLEAP